VPPARPHDQRRQLALLRQGVRLPPAPGSPVRDVAPQRVAQVGLPVERVLPRRRVRVFKVGHERGRAAVERIDDHLAVDGARDLDAAVDQAGRGRGAAPRRVGAHGLRVRQKIRQLAGVEPLLARLAGGEQGEAAAVEAAVEGGEEAEGVRGEDGSVLVRHGAEDLIVLLAFWVDF